MIERVLTALPARHGAAVDAEFARQRGIAGLAFLDIGTSARRGRGIGVQLKIHQPALPMIGLRRRRRVRETLAPVGPQGPPTRRAAKLAGVAARARGCLLWTTGTSCAASRIRRCCHSHSTACHNRTPSRQSSETKHEGGGRYMDNIFVERLWRSLKYEEVYLNAYASVAEAKAGRRLVVRVL